VFYLFISGTDPATNLATGTVTDTGMGIAMYIKMKFICCEHGEGLVHSFMCFGTDSGASTGTNFIFQMTKAFICCESSTGNVYGLV
jgi:hypothetical protein